MAAANRSAKAENHPAIPVGTVKLTSYAKNGPNSSFFKEVLDRFFASRYFWNTSVILLHFSADLTEREEADVRLEDRSQDGTMPRRPGLAHCLFARTW